LPVHDELVFDATEEELQIVPEFVKATMEVVGTKSGFPKIEVPLTVDCSVSAN
jgi:DNA polymerase I-like protein with 3'-5' exonuclease and polymerase domains